MCILLQQMAFSYIVMQCLPSTYKEFSNSSNTFASIIYGKNKYGYNLWCYLNILILFYHRGIKQDLTPNSNCLGGSIHEHAFTSCEGSHR